MSHFVTIETTVKDIEALRSACSELGFTVEEKAVARGIGTQQPGDYIVRLHGPCFRCLEDAVLDLPISAREYHANAAEGDDELLTPYVEDDKLDLSAWARDALALELPDKILCRADCAGLCPVCGKNLNDEPHEHDEHEADPRWAALAELRDRL